MKLKKGAFMNKFFSFCLLGLCFGLGAQQVNHTNEYQDVNEYQNSYGITRNETQSQDSLRTTYCSCGCPCKSPCYCGCQSGKPCNCPRK